MQKLNLQKNIFVSFVLYISLLPFVFLLSIAITINTNSLNAMMVGFLLLLIYTICFSIRYFGFLSLYCIYLYTSTFFIYDGFIFTLFFNKDFLYDNFLGVNRFDEKIGFQFIIICFVNVFVMHISYCLFDKRSFKENISLPTNSNLNKFGKIIMLISIIPVMTKLMIQFNYIRTVGYLALYTGDLLNLKYPFWTTGSFIFFTSGYSLLLASNPKKRDYILYTILCALVYLTNSLKGQRAGFISIIVYFFYYYYRHYGVKIKIKNIFFFVLLIGAFVGIMGSARKLYGSSGKETQIKNIEETVKNTIYSQSRSRAVPMYVIKGDLKYHTFPFLFSSLVRPILKLMYPSEAGQTVIVAEHYNTTGVITYNHSKKGYLSGCGFGGAFLAEAYDFFGYFGLILLSVFLSKFFVFCDYSRLNVRRQIVPLLFYVLQGIPFLPRSNVFRFLDHDAIKIVCAYFFFVIFINARIVFKPANDLSK